MSWLLARLPPRLPSASRPRFLSAEVLLAEPLRSNTPMVRFCGVVMRPMLTSPNPPPMPTEAARVQVPPAPDSMSMPCSKLKIAFSPPPRSSWPRTPSMVDSL